MGTSIFAGMSKAAAPLSLSPEQKDTLEAWVRAPSSPQSLVARARICLAPERGDSNAQIAAALHTTRPTVLLWRSRFAHSGPAGLEQDAPRGQSVQRLKPDRVRVIVETTLHTTPPAATHWSTRPLAQHCRVSHMSVARIWDAHGLQPQRVQTFKLYRDKQFVEKLTDVVGLSLNPPDKALVLCVDEKSQIQALDRTQPGLPMKKGRCGTMTQDYVRHGTTTLFAALNVLAGQVLGGCFQRHRHEEFLAFLRQIDRETPPELALHLIVDNYGTHKHERVREWLVKHRRFHLHFTPTSSPWLNLVERWLAEITRKRIRRGSFGSVAELVAAIEDYIRVNNENPKPFVWTKHAEQILEKLRHCKAVTVTEH